MDPEIKPPFIGVEYCYKGYAYDDMQHLTKNIGVIMKYPRKNKYFVPDPGVFNIDVYAYRIR